MTCWGFPGSNLRFTDIHQDGTTALEMELAFEVLTYRAYRFPWRSKLFMTDSESLVFGAVPVGDTGTLPLTIKNNSNSALKINCFLTTNPAFTVNSHVPQSFWPGQEKTFEVEFSPGSNGPTEGKLYVRSLRNSDLIAQDVALSGIGGGPVAVGDGLQAPVRLHSSVPNPASASTSVRFDLSVDGWVTLDVYDLRGRRVESLVNEARPAGQHLVTWSARGHAAGVYYYRLKVDDFEQTKNFVIVK